MFNKTFEVVVKILGTRYAYTFHYEADNPISDEQIVKIFMEDIFLKGTKKTYNLKTKGKFTLASLRALK